MVPQVSAYCQLAKQTLSSDNCSVTAFPHQYLTQCVFAADAGPVAEQVLLLENIATSLKTGPDQLPTIHKLLLEAVSTSSQDSHHQYYYQLLLFSDPVRLSSTLNCLLQ